MTKTIIVVSFLGGAGRTSLVGALAANAHGKTVIVDLSAQADLDAIYNPHGADLLRRPGAGIASLPETLYGLDDDYDTVLVDAGVVNPEAAHVLDPLDATVVPVLNVDGTSVDRFRKFDEVCPTMPIVNQVRDPWDDSVRALFGKEDEPKGSIASVLSILFGADNNDRFDDHILKGTPRYRVADDRAAAREGIPTPGMQVVANTIIGSSS